MTDLQPWDTILANYKDKERVVFLELSAIQDDLYTKLIEYLDKQGSGLLYNGPLGNEARTVIDSKKLAYLQGPSLDHLRSNGWNREMFDIVVIHGDKPIKEAVLDVLLGFNVLKTGGLFILSGVTNFDLLNVFATVVNATSEPSTNKEANILVYKK